MKLKKEIVYSVLIMLFFQCYENNDKEIEIGKITERSEEEIATFKEYAPTFTLQSIKGESVSLNDLKGKILYVDIWATWCKPCLQQLPAMKQMEEKYRGTDIEFVSISIDKDSDRDKWTNMVMEEKLKGIQLFAGKQTSFQRDYEVSSIPRFFIIGKEGEILNNNPPRPSDPRTGGLNQDLISILDKLNSEKKEL